MDEFFSWIPQALPWPDAQHTPQAMRIFVVATVPKRGWCGSTNRVVESTSKPLGFPQKNP